jgi:hypothetical protein
LLFHHWISLNLCFSPLNPLKSMFFTTQYHEINVFHHWIHINLLFLTTELLYIFFSPLHPHKSSFFTTESS